jgi:hypothetical protein
MVNYISQAFLDGELYFTSLEEPNYPAIPHRMK